jgi:glycine C-acetyltransferase
MVAACTAAVEVAATEPEHNKKLWDNTNYFKKEVQDLGYNTGASATPIIPLIVGDPGKAQKLAERLFTQENIFATPIVFPMVARELSRIRVQMNALLTKDDLDYAIAALKKIGNELEII